MSDKDTIAQYRGLIIGNIESFNELFKIRRSLHIEIGLKFGDGKPSEDEILQTEIRQVSKHIEEVEDNQGTEYEVEIEVVCKEWISGMEISIENAYEKYEREQILKYKDVLIQKRIDHTQPQEDKSDNDIKTSSVGRAEKGITARDAGLLYFYLYSEPMLPSNADEKTKELKADLDMKTSLNHTKVYQGVKEFKSEKKRVGPFPTKTKHNNQIKRFKRVISLMNIYFHSRKGSIKDAEKDLHKLINHETG